MRKLGEQWVEEIDGKEHMVKCVAIIRNPSPAENHWFDGYSFSCQKITNGEYFHYEIIKAKDLGSLNSEGFLPEERTGLYPTHEHAYILGATGNSHIIGVKTEHEHVYVCDSSYGRCKERWNRRA